jgi:hypothetical protein
MVKEVPCIETLENTFSPVIILSPLHACERGWTRPTAVNVPWIPDGHMYSAREEFWRRELTQLGPFTAGTK